MQKSEEAVEGDSGKNLEVPADAGIGKDASAFPELDFGDAVGGFGGFQIGEMPVDAGAKIGGVEVVGVYLLRSLALVGLALTLEMVVHADEVNLVEAHKVGELDCHIGDGGPVPEAVVKVVVEAGGRIVLDEEGERVGTHIVPGVEAQKLRHGQGLDIAAELGKNKGVHSNEETRQKPSPLGEEVNAVEPEGVLAAKPSQIHAIEAGPVSQNEATLAGVGIAEALEASDIFLISRLEARRKRRLWLRNLQRSWR